MKIYLIIGTFLLVYNYSHSQNPKTNPFQMVVIPDSLRIKMAHIQLQKEKLETVFDSSYKAIYVFNLINRKEFKFVNGIYTWKTMGPHFPRRLFILNNNVVYIFRCIGAFDPTCVIEEYLKCTQELKLTDTVTRKYLKIISQYLLEEEGQTYGQEIKKANTNTP